MPKTVTSRPVLPSFLFGMGGDDMVVTELSTTIDRVQNRDWLDGKDSFAQSPKTRRASIQAP